MGVKERLQGKRCLLGKRRRRKKKKKKKKKKKSEASCEGSDARVHVRERNKVRTRVSDGAPQWVVRKTRKRSVAERGVAPPRVEGVHRGGECYVS